jgi:plastocyanin
MMKRILIHRSPFVLLAAFASAFVLLAAFTSADDKHDDEHAEKSKTFTVLVGAEDVSQGATVVAFFPDTVRIHVGDTVHWQRNANEIHTVTFLAGTPLPLFTIPAPPGLPSPRMRNPVTAFPTVPANGQYDGTTFANSGIFGPDPGIFQGVQSFDLTFTKPGTYNYICAVHGVAMSGKVIVVARDVDIPSPSKVNAEATRLIADALAQVPAAIALGNAEVPAPTPNPDGTTTFHVLVGFDMGQLGLVHFFPTQLTVHPGDTVEWALSKEDHGPHTITFLNGNPSPDDLLVVPQPNGPPLLLVNPAVLFPQNPGQPLTSDGIHSSGLLSPVLPGFPKSFSLKIGDINNDDNNLQEPYVCLLHDSSGMKAVLHIVPRDDE